MPAAASVRELKNQTTKLLRTVEKGTLIVVTRRGKPIATLKPFEEQDLRHSEQYPTTRNVPFSSWQEMDRAIKGDRSGLTR